KGVCGRTQKWPIPEAEIKIDNERPGPPRNQQQNNMMKLITERKHKQRPHIINDTRRYFNGIDQGETLLPLQNTSCSHRSQYQWDRSAQNIESALSFSCQITGNI